MITKNNIVCIAVAIIGIFSSIQNTTAQVKAKDYEILGIVSDSTTNKTLDFITVGLKNEQNVVVRTILTKTDGNFIFSNLKPLKYTVSIIAMGYQPKVIVVDLSDSLKKSADLGRILIHPSANNLKELEIIGSRPLIKQEIDRISYDLQADPESKINSVLEMMRKVPLLSLDAEDNIQLKGSTNYKILIDGKPSSMLERSPKEVLRSMPASTIRKIEVITTPPAKYDAEGLTGIINIITNKRTENGYNGALNLNGKMPVGGPGIGGSFAFKQGSLGISAYGGGALHNSPQTQGFTNRRTFGIAETNLTQDNLSESDNRTGYLGTEISYEIDSLNLISTQLNINGSHLDGASSQASVLNDKNGVLQQYHLQNNNKGIGSGLDAAINYQLGFKSDKSRLLTFSYRYYTYDNDNTSALALSNLINYDVPDYRQINLTDFSENTFQLDYVQSVKKLNIEAGLKGIFRDNKSNFQYLTFNSATNEFDVDVPRSNQFNNSQNVFAAYNTYQFSLKDWGFKAGLRIEKTNIDADFLSSGTQVKQDFFNVIPSLAISRKFKTSSLNFGFTQRIQRPGIYQLNPFVDRSNPNIESTGNPNLKPIIGNVIQLSYGINKKAFINLGLDYTFFKTLINQVSAFDPVSNITRITYQNTGNAKLFGASFNVNYPVSKKWSFSVNAKAAYGIIEGMSNGEFLKTEGLMYAISMSTGYNFDKGWRMNGSYSMNGKNISLQRTTNAYISSSLGLSKVVVKDKLTFSASVSNPFNKYRHVLTDVTGPGFLQTGDNRNYFRSYVIAVSYNFGKLKEAIKKNKRGIKNDDVSN